MGQIMKDGTGARVVAKGNPEAEVLNVFRKEDGTILIGPVDQPEVAQAISFDELAASYELVGGFDLVLDAGIGFGIDYIPVIK